MKVADFAEEGFIVDFVLLQNFSQFALKLSIISKVLLLFGLDLFKDSLNGIPWVGHAILSLREI